MALMPCEAKIPSIVDLPRRYVWGARWAVCGKRVCMMLCILREAKSVEIGGCKTSSLKSPITTICSWCSMRCVMNRWRS